MTVSLRRSHAEVQREPPRALHAPLFQQVLSDIDPAMRTVVLDLGAASTSMLDRLGGSRCCVEIADVAHFGGCDRLNALESVQADAAPVADDLLPDRMTGDPVDVVFCWDLLNYLTLPALKALMRSVGRRCREGAVAHALIYYAERDMPDSPGRFIPTEHDGLMNLGETGKRIDAPRYSPEELGDHMAGFAIDRARLLNNGMQEFLFRF